MSKYSTPNFKDKTMQYTSNPVGGSNTIFEKKTGVFKQNQRLNRQMCGKLLHWMGRKCEI